MSRKHVISRPTKNQDISYEEIDDELNSNWQDKARALLMRRQRALKHEVKRSY